jgi:hypothetical protein
MRTLAGAAVLAAAAAGTAQAGSRPVVVVSTKTYRVLAWDSGRKVCAEIAAVAHNSSACGSPRVLTFAQLPVGVGNETFVGGVTTSKARTVDVVFANGATLHTKARIGRRYRGRRHSRLRFFAAREKALTTVSSLTAKDGHGHTVQTLQIPPPGTPVPPEPPPNPKPCGCPPPTELKACPAIVCPYASSAWTRNW